MTPKELTQVDVEATDMLTREGFHEYAAGHYAKDAESVSVHECGEWAGESLVGLGPAAMSFVSGTLFKNAPSLKSYRKNVDTGQVHQPVELSRADIARRTALLNLAKLLRLDLNELMAKHGDAASQICQDVRRLGVLGYVQEVSPGVFVPNKGDISVTAFELSRFDTQGMSRRVLVGI